MIILRMLNLFIIFGNRGRPATHSGFVPPNVFLKAYADKSTQPWLRPTSIIRPSPLPRRFPGRNKGTNFKAIRPGDWRRGATVPNKGGFHATTTTSYLMTAKQTRPRNVWHQNLASLAQINRALHDRFSHHASIR
jgi:hypothetical protein